MRVGGDVRGLHASDAVLGADAVLGEGGLPWSNRSGVYGGRRAEGSASGGLCCKEGRWGRMCHFTDSLPCAKLRFRGVDTPDGIIHTLGRKAACIRKDSIKLLEAYILG